MSDSDRVFMKRALALARQGEGLVSPNPIVGAVIVDQGRIVGEGFHLYERLKHAESYALEAGGKSARGATLYCSLEPCCHDGRTSPCTDAIIENGLARVVVAMEDPDPRVNGKGIRLLEEAGIEVDVGLCSEEARRENECYIKHIRTKIPFIHLIIPPEDGNWHPSQDLLDNLFRYDGLVLATTGDAGKGIFESFVSKRKHRVLEVMTLEENGDSRVDAQFQRSDVHITHLDKSSTLPTIVEAAKEHALTSFAMVGDASIGPGADCELIDKVTITYRDESSEASAAFSWRGRNIPLEHPQIVRTKRAIEVTGYPRWSEADRQIG